MDHKEAAQEIRRLFLEYIKNYRPAVGVVSPAELLRQLVDVEKLARKGT